MGILDEVKSVANTIRQIDNIELYKQILDLQAEILKLVEENNSLRSEVGALKGKLTTREKLIFKKNAYWIPSEGSALSGPFCSNCWDVRLNVVRMHMSEGTGFGECPTCRVPVEIERQDYSPQYSDNDEY